MYLRHIEGHYSQGGVCTPLALLWKDESCSRYLLVGWVTVRHVGGVKIGCGRRVKRGSSRLNKCRYRLPRVDYWPSWVCLLLVSWL